jgi:anthranilate phosphoribosyltransferase
VFEPKWLEPVAETLGALGVRRAYVVHSRDGLDEISLSDTTLVAEMREGRVGRHELAPEDFGFKRAAERGIEGGDAETNARILERVLSGEPGPARDIVVLNAALALVAAEAAGDLREGATRAAESIDSGAAAERLRSLVEFSNRATA